jgi:hypothetical protein
MNRDKHIWEGWTVGDFIDDLNPLFRMIQNPNSSTIREGFNTKNELRDWCMGMQPYYKKHIPEVYNYFLNKTEL